MRQPRDKIERSLLKIMGWTLAVIILLIGGGVLGHRSFRSWQQRRLVAQADALVARGDYKHASLDARRLLQIAPDNIEGCRIMARISEAAGVHSALDWRRRVIELPAARGSDFIALGRIAVRYEDWKTTSFALAKLPEQDKNSAEYHALLADIALVRQDGNLMARELGEAVRLEPRNMQYALRLATVQLGASDSSVREGALRALHGMRSEASARREATRRLIEDALRQKQTADALTLARELDGLPERNLVDRLLLLTALQAANDSGFAPLLQEVERFTEENGEQVAMLINWMNAHQLPQEAVPWARRLPPGSRENVPVAIALSDSYIATHDWGGMLRFVKMGSWGHIDFLRSALAARAERELGHEADYQTQWRDAVKKVNADPKGALRLAEIAEKWGWEAERIELLWLAARDAEKGDQSLETLYREFAKLGDTQGLYRVLLHREEMHPADGDIQNNVAQLSLLLNLNVDRARRLAHDLYEKEPRNAAYVSTQAFALYTSGDARQALKVMKGLRDEQLREPQVAAYFGIFLAANGEIARAVEFLDLGETARLLPEEKALVAKARSALAAR